MEPDPPAVIFPPGPGAFNQHLDCENLDQMTDNLDDIHRPSFFTTLMRFFGNIFVDMFSAIFS
ncbi:uncharacterized protein LOC108112321 [Drosophila eugracilis]|uniref:uncharacterized protein LOC108112321 n=1 Tax=Drosophila eugracilis TaxID=29029 RepID=UPI0007E7DA26|nr:uncharacterized protein LOC108112321 [Drosophila eugracilis]